VSRDTRTDNGIERKAMTAKAERAALLQSCWCLLSEDDGEVCQHTDRCLLLDLGWKSIA